MAVIPLDSSILRVGQPLPVAVRDVGGHVLLPRGALLTSEAQRKALIARGIYVAANDGEQFKRALASKVDTMLRSNALLGQIAHAVPDSADYEAAVVRRRLVDPVAAWNAIMLRASALLHDPPETGFSERVERLDSDVLALLDSDTDASLLTLVHNATNDVHNYSVNHALLAMVVCELAARQLPWPADWRPSLRRATLTMNLAMTQLQDRLALQDAPLTLRQRQCIETHALESANQMRVLGVTDELWLEAVERHHIGAPGTLEDGTTPQRLARLIQRCDIFAARLSPRAIRQAMDAAAAAKAAYMDENQKADAAGSAIIKALGIYPPGSFVRLSSGEVAIVLRRGRNANQPRVVSVIGRSGTPLGEPAVRDTRLPPHEVASGVPPHSVKLRLHLPRLLQFL